MGDIRATATPQPADQAQWQTIESAPVDGSRVRLGHERDRSSMRVDTIFPISGYFDGRWMLSSFFTFADEAGRLVLSDQPTHWLPA